MRVTLDTNALARIVVSDDAAQSAIAKEIVANATLIAVTVPCICELVWVLRTVYRFNCAMITDVLKSLLEIRNIVLDIPTVEAGIQILESGGDFADGAIAHEGRLLGGETFVSFDKRAVMLVEQYGGLARLLQVGRS